MRIRTVVDGFRRRLESLGYTPGTVAYQLVVGRFGRWLAVHCRPVDRIDSADIYAFIADQRRDGLRHGVFRQGLVLLRAYLVDVRAVPADHRRRGMWWVSWSIPIVNGCCASVGWPQRPCAVIRPPPDASLLSAPVASI